MLGAILFFGAVLAFAFCGGDDTAAPIGLETGGSRTPPAEPTR
jgi:hypothetical protein